MREKVFYLLLLSLVGCLADDSDEFIFTHEVCPAGIGEPFKDLNGEGDLEGGIFYGLSFNCEGKLSRWEFNAANTGTFYADVWDVDRKTDKATLMGSTKIKVTETGFQDIDLDPVQKLCIQPGFVIGVHYDDQATQAVLFWERPPGTSGVKISKYQTVGRNVAVGTEVDIAADFGDGSPGLKGVVLGVLPNLQLAPEGDLSRGGRFGRAEVKKGDAWGAICDKWFNVLGWPNLFCVELGFPGALNAGYSHSPLLESEEDWEKYVVAEDYPIHMKNPRCKVSDNLNFVSCNRHHHDCGHDLDMFVECKPKIKCEHNRTHFFEGKRYNRLVTRCVPMIYEDGEWGYISESKDQATFVDNPNTWMAAFCHQIGLQNVKEVIKAANVDLVTDKYPVLRCDPKCMVDNPKKLSNCPCGPYDEALCQIHNVPYITCEIEKKTAFLIQQEAEAQAEKERREALRAQRLEQEKINREGHQAIQAVVRPAVDASNEAHGQALRAEHRVQRLKGDLERYQESALKQAENAVIAADRKANRKIQAAEKEADRLDEVAEKALEKVNSLTEGTPAHARATDKALQLMDRAKEAAKTAIETAEIAQKEADDAIAAAHEEYLAKVKVAAEKAEIDMKEAIMALNEFIAEAVSLIQKANAVISQVMPKLTEASFGYGQHASGLIAASQKKVNTAEDMSKKLMEKAVNVSTDI